MLKKKIIYEFDDGVFLTNFPKSKTKKIISLSNHVIAGNKLLYSYAKQYNANVTIIPTGVLFNEYQKYAQNKQNNDDVIVGWIGSGSGLKYLKNLEPAFENLEKKGIKFTLVVICNEDVKMNLKNKRFIKWTRDSAIQDMSCFDIGIMPLDDTEFSRYKCGFKIIQYIAMSIPVIASPVGVNVEMIENGISGFLADSLSDWEHSLEILIKDKNLRDKMAYAAYIRNKKFYDLNAINEKYEEVMKTMMTNHY